MDTQNRETDCNADKMFKSQTVILGHFSCKHCGHLSETDIYDIYKELSTAVHWTGNIWNDGLCNVLAELHYHILNSYLHNKPRNKTNSMRYFVQSMYILRIVSCLNKKYCCI